MIYSHCIMILGLFLVRGVRRRTGYVGEGKKAFLRLKREVLDQILLRRTKVNRSSDICLPPRIVRVRQHRLDEREEVGR